MDTPPALPDQELAPPSPLGHPCPMRPIPPGLTAVLLLVSACGQGPSGPGAGAPPDAVAPEGEDVLPDATPDEDVAPGADSADEDAASPAADLSGPEGEVQADVPDPHPEVVTPGRVVWRRLNRTQLANTWRDLLPVGDLSHALAADLPADDTGYGFDTTASTLSLSPLHLELLARASETLADAVTNPPLTAPVVLHQEAELLTSTATWGGPGNGRMLLASGGELVVPLTLPRAGTWHLEVRACEEAAGADHARFTVLVDGAPVRSFEVPTACPTTTTLALDLALPAGDVTVELSYINDYYAPPLDRNLAFDWVRVTGPAALDTYEATPWAAVVACTPEALSAEAAPEAALPADGPAPCARETLTRLAQRAWRRPDFEDATSRLLAMHAGRLAAGDSALEALRAGISAILLAPQALFRTEFVPAGEASAALDPWAVASRLSYFLWSTMPDAAGFEAARSGALSTPEGIAAEVSRMLADPRAEALVANFAGQWLHVRDIANLIPDPGAFPSFDEPLRAAMREELERFLRAFLLGDRDMLGLLTSSDTWLNPRLARHYGVEAPAEDTFEPFAFQPATVRPGLLGKAGLMSVLATPFRTSAVRRGKWVLAQLLCSEPPAPPPGVEGLIPATTEDGAPLTMRERMELHKTAPACIACHTVMDPIGFALERYDGLGAWRETELGLPIDDSGQLPGGQTFHGPGELADLLAADPRLPACMAEKLFIYALGRGVTASDEATLDAITAAFSSSGHRFSALAAAIATALPFRFQEADAP
jgi:hypothetical protein